MDVLDEVDENEIETNTIFLNPPNDPQCSDEDSGDEENLNINNLPRTILTQPVVDNLDHEVVGESTKKKKHK